MGCPSTFPTGTTNYQPEKCWNGYTLFPVSRKGIALIDMNGKVVHYWKDFQGMPAKMIPGGKIFGSLGQRDRSIAYQDYTDVTEVDWNGNILWSFNHNQFVNDEDSGPVWVARQHHDYQIEGNPVGYYSPAQQCKDDFNKVLILCHNDVKNSKISPQLLLEDTLLEVDRAGNILWRWNLLKHLNEFNLTDIQKNAIFRDPNTQLRGPEGQGDLFHINSASYLGENHWYDEGDERFHLNNIIMDSREANIMFIISHETGKIVWSIGPDFTSNRALRIMGIIIGMHHAHMIPKGLPGEGNILVFDNGGWAGYGSPSQTSKTGMKVDRRDSSRVIEFNPITLKIVWQFSASDMGFKSPMNAHFFYSPLVSSAQRLENGNTLITEGANGRFLEVTPEKEVVWEYIFPYLEGNAIYRAYRVPYTWVPQLEKPNEVPVIPPANEAFHLPGASDTSLDEGIIVAGTKGYGTSESFCVEKL